MKLQDAFFLVAGVVITGLGYSVMASMTSTDSNSKWWSFGAVLLGGLILGKWLSDYMTMKGKK